MSVPQAQVPPGFGNNAENLSIEQVNIENTSNSHTVVSNTNVHNYLDTTSLTSAAKDRLYRAIAPGALHNSSDQCDKTRCHPGTRVAVQDAVHKWISNDNQEHAHTRILWVSGPAGSGKTAVMASVADALQSRGDLAASFFFSSFSDIPARRLKKHLIPTLAYQLCLHPALHRVAERILTALSHDPAILDMCVQDQLERLVLQPLRAAQYDVDDAAAPGYYQQRYPRVLVIDGVDECKAPKPQGSLQAQRRKGFRPRSDEDEQVEIIASLLHVCTDPAFPFRIILSSRLEYWITTCFSSAAAQGLVVELRLDERYRPSADVEVFLRSKLAELRYRYPELGEWPSEEDTNELVTRAGGSFLYAVTAISFLETPSTPPDAQLERVLNLRRDITTTSPNSTGGASAPHSLLDDLYSLIVQTTPGLSIAGNMPLSTTQFTTAARTELTSDDRSEPAEDAQLTPEAYQRYIATQQRIAHWVDATRGEAPCDAFTTAPSVPPASVVDGSNRDGISTVYDSRYGSSARGTGMPSEVSSEESDGEVEEVHSEAGMVTQQRIARWVDGTLDEEPCNVFAQSTPYIQALTTNDEGSDTSSSPAAAGSREVSGEVGSGQTTTARWNSADRRPGYPSSSRTNSDLDPTEEEYQRTLVLNRVISRWVGQTNEWVLVSPFEPSTPPPKDDNLQLPNDPGERVPERGPSPSGGGRYWWDSADRRAGYPASTASSQVGVDTGRVHSPQEWERYIENQHRIARWVDATLTQRPCNPFTPSTPHAEYLKILEEENEGRKKGRTSPGSSSRRPNTRDGAKHVHFGVGEDGEHGSSNGDQTFVIHMGELRPRIHQVRDGDTGNPQRASRPTIYYQTPPGVASAEPHAAYPSYYPPGPHPPPAHFPQTARPGDGTGPPQWWPWAPGPGVAPIATGLPPPRPTIADPPKVFPPGMVVVSAPATRTSRRDHEHEASGGSTSFQVLPSGSQHFVVVSPPPGEQGSQAPLMVHSPPQRQQKQQGNPMDGQMSGKPKSILKRMFGRREGEEV